MTNGRWVEVEDDVAAACRHLACAVEIFRTQDLTGADLSSYTAAMGFLHAMQAGYTALESALARILRLLDEAPPSGPDWHADLLKRAARAIPSLRPAILSPELMVLADEARRFRHVAMKSYDSFIPENATRAVAAADRLAATLPDEIARFRQTIDPVTDQAP